MDRDEGQPYSDAEPFQAGPQPRNSEVDDADAECLRRENFIWGTEWASII